MSSVFYVFLLISVSASSSQFYNDRGSERVNGLKRGGRWSEVHLTPSGQTAKASRGFVKTTVLNGPYQRSIFKEPTKRGKADWFSNQGENRYKSFCFLCPSNRTVVAKKSRTWVIMERPPIQDCSTLEKMRGVKGEIVRGPQPGDHVREGSHTVMLRVNRGASRYKTCRFTYTVLVRKCEAFATEDEELRYTCSGGESWGSRCNFSCSEGHQLEGYSTIHCNNNLQWSAPLPRCKRLPRKECPLPASPDEGYISCWSPMEMGVQGTGLLPTGSVCHYRCNPGYYIPYNMKSLATVSCYSGEWDTTQDPICIKSSQVDNNKIDGTSNELPNSMRLSKCYPGLCKNGGRCRLVLGEARCFCRTPYTGLRCTQKINS